MPTIRVLRDLLLSPDGSIDVAGAYLLGRALVGLSPADPAITAIADAVSGVMGGHLLHAGPGPLSTADLCAARNEAAVTLRERDRGEGGPQALAFAAGPVLAAFVEDLVGTVFPMGDAVVHGATDGPLSDPALGRIGEVRGWLVLETSVGAAISVRAASGSKSIPIQPGSTLVYHASTVRFDLHADERTILLSFGFLSGRLTPRLPPFVATPSAVADRMLALARATGEDAICDLGCGDGSILCRAARLGATKLVGIEANPDLARKARLRLAATADIRVGDVRSADIGAATIVTLFLNPELTEAIRPRLEEALDPRAKVVTHMWPVRGWVPRTAEIFRHRRTNTSHRLFLYGR